MSPPLLRGYVLLPHWGRIPPSRGEVKGIFLSVYGDNTGEWLEIRKKPPIRNVVTPHVSNYSRFRTAILLSMDRH